MQHDREARNALLDFGEDVETDARILARLEFVGAVGGADGDRQRVDAGALDEIFHLFRTGIGVRSRLDVIFDAGENAEFAFDGDVELVRVFHNLAGFLDVLLIGEMGSVDHDRGEAVVDAALAGFEIRTVIEVKDDRNAFAAGNLLSILDRALRHVTEQSLVGVFAGPLRDLEDDRGFRFDTGLNDRLHLFHIVEIVRGDRVSALDCLLEQLTGVHKAEIFVADRHEKDSFLKF